VRTRIGKIAEHRGEQHVTCEEVITFLLEYLTKELEAEEEMNFERHLAICPSCVAYLKTYKQAIHLGKVALGGDFGAKPPELGVELMRAILSARG
jgi:anti-sigma factor RsiW